MNNTDEGDPISKQPTLLEQLRASGKILSNSFGMHMGSAQHGQPGSLVLGGYEQNRALGDVGLFNSDDRGTPHIFLLDVILDTQAGLSPFRDSSIGSVYKGLGDNSYAAEYARFLGGTDGSAVVALSPSVPYIYLPPGTCETAGQYLPATWDEDMELYKWNPNDPQYARIVNSLAYLGFIFADRNASNITIKVPFRLLNPTLSLPLVDLPIPTSRESTILSTSIASFEESWLAHWTVITEPARHKSKSDNGLPYAVVAAIAVVGTVTGVGLIYGGLVLLWRRGARQALRYETTKRQNDDGYSSTLEITKELDASPTALDKSDCLPHELHEAPEDPTHYELPTD
ncbi:hypothetical protein F5X98DRAFT_383021 [Xylaria grammica]|nr:hypothetical protein F5X98DRAFT_383021 [Xylaria grammica]